MTSAIHYYIYYPVRMGLEADLTRTLYNLQDELRGQTGVAGRFLRKADDPWTWMEIYENVTDSAAFDDALAQGLDRHGIARFIDDGGRRHTERFVACA
ncbi:DUF4936 family protein [Zoogloea sp. 1C4]|uniref:DUF4936 family protein n=1 Tax=Zoogloea sp. 1C4 TaxID=2570190 RepID=UPI001291FCE8|nr:DUF4936 family protein [Zoogloea sp. 1C4]